MHCADPTVALGWRASRVIVGERRFKNDAAGEKRESEERMQKMATRLKLTNDQVTKVQAIMQDKHARMTEMREQYKGQPVTPERKAAMMKE